MALNPNTGISQYAHTAWRLQDGLLSSPPTAIAQTRDGYIWIGTGAGLLRFDGVTFTPWQPPSGQLQIKELIVSLLASSDGSLWIGTGHDFARWDGTRLTRYTQFPGRVDMIAEGRPGEIWLTRSRQPDQHGSLCQVVQFKTHCIGASEGNPIPFASAVAADSANTTWLAGISSIFRYGEGGGSSYPLPSASLKGVQHLSSVDALSVDPHGGLWVGMQYGGPGMGLQHLDGGHFSPIHIDGFDSSRLKVEATFTDRSGVLWIGTYDDGVYRVYRNRVDHYTTKNGLSADEAEGFLEDHEGNIWVVTPKGIDRFRDLSVLTYSIEEGLSSNDVASVLANRDGSIWSLSFGRIDVLRGQRLSPLRLQDRLPGLRVESVLQDRDGRVWIGVDNGLYVIDQGRFWPVIRSDKRPLGPVVALAQDTDGRVWVATVGPADNLSRVDPLARVAEPADVQLNHTMRIVPDSHSGVWAMSIDGRVAHIRHEGKDVAEYSPIPKRQKISTILQGTDGTLYIWSTGGLTLVRGTESRFLPGAQDDVCLHTFSSIFDKDGAMWVASPCGLTRFPNDEVRAWWGASHIAGRDRLVLDQSDGFNASAATFQPTSTMSADGRLWFATQNGLLVVDPRHLAINPIPPPVHIAGFIVDHTALPIADGLSVPARARDVEIDYSALSFSAPQKVLFRYQLKGRDDAWQSVGTRRQAFFTDLKPGHYTFHVIACNNSGIWNEHGETVDFVVNPAWYQMMWFRVLCLLLATVLAWGIFRLRVRQIEEAMSARFDERLAERTRIARELHDTFLQTIQGSKLVAVNALKNTHDPVRTGRALEQLSEWLVRANEEGRAALHSLRTSTKETNELAAGLQQALRDYRGESPMEAVFKVHGDVREMHPIVRDEIYLIGHEAIRNAYMHSAGTRLNVDLVYENYLSLTVRDNGVGIDPTIVDAGKSGHFGMPSMRERAARIGARLLIETSPTSGTEIRILVPGSLAFSKPRPSPLDKIKTVFHRPKGN